MARIVDPEGREPRALDRLVDFRGKDVLELGCGDGRTTRHVARTARSVVGVDPDAEAISRARSAGERRKRVEFLADNAVSLELPPGGFDVVLFSRSL